MKTRLSRLGQQLHCLADNRRRGCFSIGALEDALEICEQAIQPLEDAYDKHAATEVQAEQAKADAKQQRAEADAERALRKQQETRINAAQSCLIDLHKRLHAVLGDEQSLRSTPTTLEEALTSFEAMVSHAEARAQQELAAQLNSVMKLDQSSIQCGSATNPADCAERPREQTCIRRCTIM